MRPPTIEVKWIQLSVRAAVAGSVALALAPLLRLEYPIYSFLAAVIVTDLSPSETRRLGRLRLMTTVVGATCGALLVQALPSSPASIGLGVLVVMLLCCALRIAEGAKVGGYVCGIVMISYSTEAWTYAAYRVVETVLGIAVAWLVSLVPKLLRGEEPSP